MRQLLKLVQIKAAKGTESWCDERELELGLVSSANKG